MKQKKFASLFLVFAMTLSMLTGFESAAGSTSETQQPAGAAAEEPDTDTNAEQDGETDENQAAAEQLLLDLEGTYQELWPVVLADEYAQIWLDDSSEMVGEENAESAVEMMASMVTGTLTGEAAVEAYQDGGMAYCCDFLQDVDRFIFEGTTVSGVDADGEELFRHSYHYRSDGYAASFGCTVGCV